MKNSVKMLSVNHITLDQLNNNAHTTFNQYLYKLY